MLAPPHINFYGLHVTSLAWSRTCVRGYWTLWRWWLSQNCQKNQVVEMPKAPFPHPSMSRYYVMTDAQKATPGVLQPHQLIGNNSRVFPGSPDQHVPLYLILPTKVDFYSLPMTCQDFSSIFPGGSWTIWAQWLSLICQKNHILEICWVPLPLCSYHMWLWLNFMQTQYCRDLS